MVNTFFSPRVASQLNIRNFFRDYKVVVFHRRQLLLLAKLAIVYCREQGIDASRNTKDFGSLFLKINDHFHFNSIPGHLIDLSNRADILGIATEMLAAKEFANGQADFSLVRSFLMCRKVAPLLTGHADYIDIDLLLSREVGVNYETMEALTFAATTRFSTGLEKQLITDGSGLVLQQSFLTDQLPRRQVNDYLSYMSTNQNEANEQVQATLGINNDLSIWKRTPLYRQWFNPLTNGMRFGYLLLDQGLLIDKVSNTPYWVGVKKGPQSFARFWGSVFEKYVGYVLEEGCRSTSSRYIHSPRLPENENNEICDGLVVGENTVVLLEYKSSMFTAGAKYSGSVTRLGNEIRKKLVYDDQTQQAKGPLQLAAAITKLFSRNSNSNPWFHRASIKRCYALVVTLDSVGGGIGISTLLNVDFQDALRSAELITEVRPLYCMDIESLEVASGSFAKATLSEVLERWYDQNPSLATPLSALRFEELRNKGPHWQREGWHDLAMRAARLLISPESLSSDANYQNELRREVSD